MFVLLSEATIIGMEDKQEYLSKKCKGVPVELHELTMVVDDLRYSNIEVATVQL